jgi:hypothetical protein
MSELPSARKPSTGRAGASRVGARLGWALGLAVAAAPMGAPASAYAMGPAAPHPASGHAGSLSAGAIAVVAVAGLAVLACAAWGLARWQAFEPRWTHSLRHAVTEAGLRASSTCSEFADWLRLGH